MILTRDRKIAGWLIRAKLWSLYRHGLFGTPSIRACWGTRWLLEHMRKRQARDGLHHAPMCPSNEWSGQQLTIHPCNCGAARMARKSA